MLNEAIKADFPTLNQKINGNDLIYLDNAATTQKPANVIKAVENYYKLINSNIHRGVHTLSGKATEAYENARSSIAEFIKADNRKEIIFVRGATEAINLVAHSYVKPILEEGDQIIISQMEHHANIVPWQIICEERKAELRIIPMNSKGELLLSEFKKLINEKTKFVSINHVSNTLGTVNPVEEIVKISQSKNIKIMIDGAQAIQHIPLDMVKLAADFYCFSGHKMYAPTGIGVLYGKTELLEKMPPYQGGGDMIKSVTFEKTIYNDIPNRFEAGTPNISGVIGLGAAIEYLTEIGMNHIYEHEKELLDYATQEIKKIERVKIIGNSGNKTSVLSFVIEEIHPHDIGTIMDKHGVAVRTGHHCTQPIMDFYGIPATARASFGIYNSKIDVDCMINAIKKTIEVFA